MKDKYLTVCLLLEYQTHQRFFSADFIPTGSYLPILVSWPVLWLTFWHTLCNFILQLVSFHTEILIITKVAIVINISLSL